MLSNTCKYAIRALIYLGKHADGDPRIGIKKISNDLSIPTPFLGKILQNLVKQKILVSTKGPNGGFALAHSADRISLYDIVKIVDGEDFFKNCLIGLHPCSNHAENGKPCPVHKSFGPVRKQLCDFYKETTIASITEDMTGVEDLILL
jgi:Rrf2 family transcriptional regulator, iron-sulfur cluster assembly transcription factor